MLGIWCQIHLKLISHLQDAQDLVQGLGQAQERKEFLICRTHKILCILQMRNPFLCRPAHGFVPSGWYTVKLCKPGG